jgi:hypothetical protein
MEGEGPVVTQDVPEVLGRRFFTVEDHGGVKKGGPKRRKQATSDLKRTVNSCYKGRMMVDPLGIATVPFVGIIMCLPSAVVNNNKKGLRCSSKPLI